MATTVTTPETEKGPRATANPTLDEASGEVHEVDPTWQKKVLRKIDKRILICCMVTYTFNFIDKILLGNSAIFGIIQDTNLVGQQFSWLSSIFYFGYLLWEYPTTLIIQKVPVGKYLSMTVIAWGLVISTSAASTNFAGLATTRFLLGFFEATAVPSFVYIVSQWYTRDEVPSRTGTWFVGSDIGATISSLIIYGLGHMKNGFAPWRAMYIIFGVLTFIWGIVMLFIMPDTIQSAKFLTEEEKQYTAERVRTQGTGNLDPLVTGKWKLYQVREALVDPKTYFFFFSYLLTQICNGGLQNFGNLVVNGFGFSSLDTILFGIPGHFVAGMTIWGFGWLASRYQNISTYLIIASLIPPVIGSSIIYSLDGKGVRLFGFYLLQTAYASNPLSLGLLAANTKGATKKMSVTAILFLGYCAGNMAGPQFFKTSEAPTYPTGFRAIMSCFALALLLTAVLRIYLTMQNRSRRGASTAENTQVVVDEASEDITDFEDKKMMYKL